MGLAFNTEKGRELKSRIDNVKKVKQQLMKKTYFQLFITATERSKRDRINLYLLKKCFTILTNEWKRARIEQRVKEDWVLNRMK
jgi:hypothetical protein